MKIFSIGCNCDTSEFVKKNYSDYYGPFDWMWCTIDFVINTFESGYFEYTACEKLNASWDPPHPHTYIRTSLDSNQKSSAVSVHDGDGLNREQYISAIPKINEKYTRRFNRLYDALNGAEDVILIRRTLDTTQGAVTKSFDTNEKLNHLSNVLSTKFNAYITICVVDNGGFIDKDVHLNDNIKLFDSFDELQMFLNYLRPMRN